MKFYFRLSSKIFCYCWTPGNRRNQSDPPDTGLHVLVSRDHQREGERWPEDFLCTHRDKQILITGDCNALTVSSRPVVLLLAHTHNVKRDVCTANFISIRSNRRKRSFVSHHGWTDLACEQAKRCAWVCVCVPLQNKSAVCLSNILCYCFVATIFLSIKEFLSKYLCIIYIFIYIYIKENEKWT